MDGSVLAFLKSIDGSVLALLCGKRENKWDGGGKGEGIGGMERCEGNVGVMDGRERWERESGGRAGRESWERNMRGRDGRESKITWIMVSQC